MSDEVDREALARLGPSAENYDHARVLLQGGASFSEVRWQLSRVGLRPEFVETVVIELAEELVRPLVTAGVATDKIRERLALRGLSDDDIIRVPGTSTATRYAGLRVRGIASGPLHAVGITLMVAGVIVWIGNTSGLFPTVRGLGLALMITGGMVSGAGMIWQR